MVPRLLAQPHWFQLPAYLLDDEVHSRRIARDPAAQAENFRREPDVAALLTVVDSVLHLQHVLREEVPHFDHHAPAPPSAGSADVSRFCRTLEIKLKRRRRKKPCGPSESGGLIAQD